MILELKEKASPLEEKFQKVDDLLDAYNKVYYETNVRANSEENYIEKPSWFNRKVELIVERQQGKENRKNLMLKLINKTLVNEFGNWADNPRLNCLSQKKLRKNGMRTKIKTFGTFYVHLGII